jgi:hypothetical protein
MHMNKNFNTLSLYNINKNKNKKKMLLKKITANSTVATCYRSYIQPANVFMSILLFFVYGSTQKYFIKITYEYIKVIF